MQFVETTLTPVQRRAGAARVLWTDLAAQQRRRGEAVRVLPQGEHVVLEVDGHAFHLGQVVSYLGEGAEGSYVVTIGKPLSRRSGRWLAMSGSAPSAVDSADAEIIDAELVEESPRVGRIPAQRRERVSLYL